MENYFTHLRSNSLPIPHWALMVIWLILFFTAQVLSKAGHNLSDKQNLILTSKTNDLVKAQSWKLTLFQILFTSAIFTFAVFIGDPFFVFFAGGWLILTAVSIPLNLRSILFLRALSQPNAATGSVTLSNRLVVKRAASDLFAMAAFCLILGVVFAQLALLGAAFFLAATATGYLRKSNKTQNAVVAD